MALSGFLKGLAGNIFGTGGRTGGNNPDLPPSKVDSIGLTPTPVSSLDSDPLRFGTYQFPKDVFENQQLGHYMIFYINQQDRSKFTYGSSSGITKQEYDEMDNEERAVSIKGYSNRLRVKKNEISGRYKNVDNEGAILATSGRNSSALQGLSSVRKTTMRIKDSIALYLPANVSDNTQAGYQDMQTGILGVALTDAIGVGGKFADKDYAAVGLTAGKMTKEFSEEILKNIGGSFVEALTGTEGAVPLANKVFGRAENPFVEVFFNSMQIRSFTYNFNFAPRNEAETAEIQQIIQLFRYHMAPELQGKNSRYLTLPSEFDIHYMYKAENGNSFENDFYNRIATCVLENVNTNYTPGGVRSFANGAPTQITMSLTFKETELLTKEKINQGY
jgi:hypothetical protein